jgi:hypothetical protein
LLFFSKKSKRKPRRRIMVHQTLLAMKNVRNKQFFIPF